MYSQLGMPHKSVDKLTFEDFLKVKDRLVAQEVQLQELNNRAAGDHPCSRIFVVAGSDAFWLIIFIFLTSLP